MSDLGVQTSLLLQAGRRLLEYNESTAEVHRALRATANALTDAQCEVVVLYRWVSVSLAGEAPAQASVGELRYNAAVQVRVHEVLKQLRQGKLDAEAGLARLETVEAATPRYPRWLSAAVLGTAASGLAGLPGADMGAAALDGIIEPLELGRFHYKKSALEDYVGARGLKRLGRKKWQRHVEKVVEHLIAALKPEDAVLGGGNAKKLQLLPPGTRLGDNANAFLGGLRLWEGDGHKPRAFAWGLNGAAQAPAETRERKHKKKA